MIFQALNNWTGGFWFPRGNSLNECKGIIFTIHTQDVKIDSLLTAPKVQPTINNSSAKA